MCSRFIRATCAVVFAGRGGRRAAGDAYPNKPIRFIVPRAAPRKSSPACWPSA